MFTPDDYVFSTPNKSNLFIYQYDISGLLFATGDYFWRWHFDDYSAYDILLKANKTPMILIQINELKMKRAHDE